MLTPRLDLRPGFLALMAGLCALLGASAAAAGLKTGDTFPDPGSAGLEGNWPDDLKGKIVLVDFWASWCGPCKQSFPVMEDLLKKYGSRGFAIVAISVDQNKKDMANFLKKNPVSFTVVRDARQRMVAQVDVAAMPSSFLLDGQGKVRFLHTGFHGAETRQQYERQIESLLGK
jgi:thiol-disulfide isomerase/thioredoxin